MEWRMLSMTAGRGLLAVAAASFGLACSQSAGPSRAPVAESAESAELAASAESVQAPSAAAGGDPGDNLLGNASFEAGREGWTTMMRADRPYWRDFDVAAIAHSGGRAAHLRFQAQGPADARAIYGVVQDLPAGTLPRYLSGWYRVQNWKRTTDNQYVQAVVIVQQPTLADGSPLSTWPNVQLAYVLAGLRTPPFALANRTFLFRGPLEPPPDEWVPFEFDVRADFERSFGALPTAHGGIRVLFEARWDGRAETEAAPGADVYYDDVYLGPRSRTR